LDLLIWPVTGIFGLFVIGDIMLCTYVIHFEDLTTEEHFKICGWKASKDFQIKTRSCRDRTYATLKEPKSALTLIAQIASAEAQIPRT